MSFKQSPLIGVDLAGRVLNAVQLQPRGSGARRLATASVSKSEPGETLSGTDLERLAEAMRARGFAGTRVATAAPVSTLLIATVEIPNPESGAPIDEIARGELAREVKKEESLLESAWWALPAAGRGTDMSRAMCVGMLRDDALEIVRKLEGGGLSPVCLDFRGLAMVRACRSLLGGAQALTTLVEIGEEATTSCVCLGATLVFHRRCDVGIGTTRKAIGKALGVDAEVAEHLLKKVAHGEPVQGVQGADLKLAVQEQLAEMAESVRAAVTYASHRYGRAEPGEVLAMGIGAELFDVAGEFSRLVGLGVRKVTLGEITGVSDHPMSGSSALVPAAGLALHGEAA